MQTAKPGKNISMKMQFFSQSIQIGIHENKLVHIFCTQKTLCGFNSSDKGFNLDSWQGQFVK